jgi:hypothetical protein
VKVFLLDLWLDLREKRLAWLAVLLLGALVAVPIVLAQGTEAPPTPPPSQSAVKPPLEPVVKSDASQIDSKLEAFNPRDPFEAPPGTAGAGGGGTGTTGGTGTGTTGGGGSTPTGGGSTPTGGGGGGTGTGTTGGGGTTTQPKRVTYTYTVDLRFGSTRIRRYNDVKRLELIPSSDNPKIVFLGVTTTAKTAVFLVNSDLGVDTEGACKPSPDECTFLYLRPDADHDTAQFTDAEGNTYELRLETINRVVVSSSDGGSSGGSNGTGTGGRSPAFTGSKRTKDSAEPAPAGETPPGEQSQPFRYRGFFSDETG